MTIGKSFLAAVLKTGSVSTLVDFGRIEHLFRGSEVPAYNFIRSFVTEYHKLPNPDTILAHTDADLPEPEGLEPPAYYRDLMIIRHVETSLKKAMSDASDLLQPATHDPQEALATMAKAVMDLTHSQFSNSVVDFRDAYEYLIPEYVSKMTLKDGKGLMFGWPTIDASSGGLVKGDVASFVGRPAAGKSWKMLYGAHHGWKAENMAGGFDENQSRLFISMEMGIIPIEQRLAAMQTSLSMTKIKNASFGTTGLNKFKDGLLEIKDYKSPFYVVDANLAATVDDIYTLVRQLNPGAVFIDGAYLLKHPTEKDRFRRVAENCELIKQMIAPLCPVVCSWQFSRTANKKNAKKGEKASIDDIGYTDAIGQVSSLVVGLFEEDSVSTLKQRKVQIMKGRNGESGSFLMNWDFDNMSFEEIIEPDLKDLEFL